jgi:hypothetical protein
MKKTTTTLAALFVMLSTSAAFAADNSADEQDVLAYSQAVSTSYAQQITTLAGNSACLKTSWKDRGRAPAGYVKGVALSFARSLCRTKALGTPPAITKIIASSATGDSSRDALTWYKSIFASAGIPTNRSGGDAVRAVYTLGMGLGMRESSGKYCEGWDKSAGSNRRSAEAEAGLFQVSYDSMGASAELKALYLEYQASPERCQLATYKEGVTCKAQGILGTGAGATYQKFNKACPAFAAEYGMTMLRLRRSHFGPINRKAAQVVSSCGTMLANVQKIVDSNQEAACEELY